jgi:hypothetical protein
MEKVEYLTNDICEGRGTGTRGSVEVAGWIARNFEKMKLMKKIKQQLTFSVFSPRIGAALSIL